MTDATAQSSNGIKQLPTYTEQKYIRLSTIVNEHLVAKQRSDKFVKALKEAMIERVVKAAPLNERFELPKKFRHRESDETYTRQTKDFAILNNKSFQKWFDEQNKALSATRSGVLTPTFENIISGNIDFEAAFEETRTKLAASKKKGQMLGKSRQKKLAEEEAEEVVTPKKKKGAAEPAAAPAKKKTAAPAPAAAPAKKKKIVEPEPEPEDEDEEDFEDEDDTDDEDEDTDDEDTDDEDTDDEDDEDEDDDLDEDDDEDDDE